jgi:hypothetical protein
MTVEVAQLQSEREMIPFPLEWKSLIATGTAPQPGGERSHIAPVAGETPPSPRKKRRGRTAGVDKIGEAITALSARLKDGASASITEIARQVGCTPQNLKRSPRFMNAYKELTGAMRRAVRRRGSKVDGVIEAWTDPREDQEEDDGDL